jgi:hypothetical protein
MATNKEPLSKGIKYLAFAYCWSLGSPEFIMPQNKCIICFSNRNNCLYCRNALMVLIKIIMKVLTTNGKSNRSKKHLKKIVLMSISKHREFEDCVFKTDLSTVTSPIVASWIASSLDCNLATPNYQSF